MFEMVLPEARRLLPEFMWGIAHRPVSLAPLTAWVLTRFVVFISFMHLRPPDAARCCVGLFCLSPRTEVPAPRNGNLMNLLAVISLVPAWRWQVAGARGHLGMSEAVE